MCKVINTRRQKRPRPFRMGKWLPILTICLLVSPTLLRADQTTLGKAALPNPEGSPSGLSGRQKEELQRHVDPQKLNPLGPATNPGIAGSKAKLGNRGDLVPGGGKAEGGRDEPIGHPPRPGTEPGPLPDRPSNPPNPRPAGDGGVDGGPRGPNPEVRPPPPPPPEDAR